MKGRRYVVKGHTSISYSHIRCASDLPSQFFVFHTVCYQVQDTVGRELNAT